MEEEKKVNLFIVGAMKAGTTSFVDMLSQHPEIYVPPIKEPHFFVNTLPKAVYEPSRFFNLDTYFEKDFPKPLHITKIEKEIQYKKAYSLATGQKYLLDASTCYLNAPEAAGNIYNYNPDARIIIVLRDPLERAYSHYKMDLGLGRTSKSFEDVMKKEVLEYRANSLSWSSYLGMSFYAQQINKFQNKFENVLVLEMEDLSNETENVLKAIKDFLQISSFGISTSSAKNISRTLKFQKLFFFLKRIGLKDFFSRAFGHKTKQWLFRVSSKKASAKIELSETVLKDVTEIFKLESTL